MTRQENITGQREEIIFCLADCLLKLTIYSHQYTVHHEHHSDEEKIGYQMHRQKALLTQLYHAI